MIVESQNQYLFKYLKAMTLTKAKSNQAASVSFHFFIFISHRFRLHIFFFPLLLPCNDKRKSVPTGQTLACQSIMIMKWFKEKQICKNGELSIVYKVTKRMYKYCFTKSLWYSKKIRRQRLLLLICCLGSETGVES